MRKIFLLIMTLCTAKQTAWAAPLTTGGVIVPASCFSFLVSDEEHPPGEEGLPVPIKKCKRDDIMPLSSDMSSFDYVYVPDTLSPSGTKEFLRTNKKSGADGHMQYRLIGNLGTSSVIYYTESDTTGYHFDSLMQVKLTDKSIHVETVYTAGGDRCSGGILSANIHESNVEYGIFITPARLIALSGALTDVDGLLDNPQSSCLGIAYKRDKTLKKVILNDNWQEISFFNDPARDQCVKKPIEKFVAHYGRDIPAHVLPEWHEQAKTCFFSRDIQRSQF